MGRLKLFFLFQHRPMHMGYIVHVTGGGKLVGGGEVVEGFLFVTFDFEIKT